MAETGEQDFNWSFENGFYPSQNASGPGIVPATIYDCLNVWLKGRVLVSDRGVTAGASTGGAVPLMTIESTHGGMTGGGTVTTAFSTRWFAGTGNAYIGGSLIGASDGHLMLVAGSAVAAGLSAPSTPTVADSGVAGSKLNGSYSIALAVYRSTTGALSSRSAPSAVLALKNKKLRITWPAVPTGATHWVIYGSRRGYGATGPWFRIGSYGLTALPTATYFPGGTTTLDIEWFDGELGDVAYIDNDPSPTNVTHCAVLGGSMVALVGNGLIRPSKVGYPEAFPPQFATNLAVREAITGCNARSTDGVVFVSTANSLNALVTGNDLTPVLPRGIWENTGFAHGNGFCFHMDQIYGFSGQKGPVRTHGGESPDDSFAVPVLKYMEDNGFTAANTIVVDAPNNAAVLFCSGNRALPFMMDGWSGPIALPGTVTAGVTLGGVGYVSIGGTLYSLDTAGAGSSWYMQSPYVDVGGKLMTLVEFYAQAKDNMTLDLFNFVTGATVGGKFPWSFTAPHGSPKMLKPNRKVRGLALKVSGSTGAQSFYQATSKVTVEPNRV